MECQKFQRSLLQLTMPVMTKPQGLCGALEVSDV
jgi:hypothetical protein